MTDEKEDTQPGKQPIDMTSDELLDYALAPELAERLRKMARGEDAEPCDSNGEDS